MLIVLDTFLQNTYNGNVDKYCFFSCLSARDKLLKSLEQNKVLEDLSTGPCCKSSR